MVIGVVAAALLAAGGQDPAIVGRWNRISQDGCDMPQLSEFTLSESGYYTFTFTRDMMETRVSDAGDYRWDADTGVLTLGKAGATFTPFRHMWAEVKDGRLTITGFSLWRNDAPPPRDRADAPLCVLVLG